MGRRELASGLLALSVVGATAVPQRSRPPTFHLAKSSGKGTNMLTSAQAGRRLCSIFDSADPSHFPALVFPDPVGKAQSVGFQDFYLEGSGPFPCSSYQDEHHRLVFTFDLSPFDDIVDGVITLVVARSSTRTRASWNQDAKRTSRATQIGVAAKVPVVVIKNIAKGEQTTTVDDVELPAMTDGDAFDTGVNPVLKVNATQVINKMLRGQEPTRAFVVAGPHTLSTTDSQSLGNAGVLSWYEVARLRVIYCPNKNPRAPQ